MNGGGQANITFEVFSCAEIVKIGLTEHYIFLYIVRIMKRQELSQHFNVRLGDENRREVMNIFMGRDSVRTNKNHTDRMFYLIQ